MAIYSGARVRLIPAGSNDPRIIPIGVILHVDAGNSGSLYDYFANKSGGIESHFFIRKDGGVEQYRDTTYEADANYHGNSFQGSDGRTYGFISVETQGYAAGEWTPEQLDQIRKLLLWAHEVHGIPLRVCPAWNAAGIGWHVMWGAPGPWTNASGKVCPGPDRVKQFNSILVPWFKTALGSTDVTPPKEDEMTDAQMKELKDFIEARTQAYAVANNNYVRQVLATATKAIVAEINQVDDEAATAVANKLQPKFDELAKQTIAEASLENK